MPSLIPLGTLGNPAMVAEAVAQAAQSAHAATAVAADMTNAMNNAEQALSSAEAAVVTATDAEQVAVGAAQSAAYAAAAAQALADQTIQPADEVPPLANPGQVFYTPDDLAVVKTGQQFMPWRTFAALNFRHVWFSGSTSTVGQWVQVTGQLPVSGTQRLCFLNALMAACTHTAANAAAQLQFRLNGEQIVVTSEVGGFSLSPQLTLPVAGGGISGFYRHPLFTTGADDIVTLWMQNNTAGTLNVQSVHMWIE